MREQVPHIVTDSTADIPPELAAHLGITVVPCHITFGTETFREGVDITREEFYRRLRSWERFSTAQPGVGVFAEAYRGLLGDGRPIVSIHLSSQLSGVYNAARLAAEDVDPERITVIDGKQVTMCTGWLAIIAAEAVQAGKPVDAVVNEVRDAIGRLRLFALIDDLRYLQRSGRVNWASALLGQVFAIKPVIVVREGHVDLTARVRTQARGLDELVSMARAVGTFERVAVLHADAPATAAALADRVAAFYPRERLLITDAGPIISGHAGPGAAGLACLYAEIAAG